MYASQAISERFGAFGAITDVYLPTEPGTDRVRGFCFVTFETQDQARAAAVSHTTRHPAPRPATRARVRGARQARLELS